MLDKNAVRKLYYVSDFNGKVSIELVQTTRICKAYFCSSVKGVYIACLGDFSKSLTNIRRSVVRIRLKGSVKWTRMQLKSASRGLKWSPNYTNKACVGGEISVDNERSFNPSEEGESFLFCQRWAATILIE